MGFECYCLITTVILNFTRSMRSQFDIDCRTDFHRQRRKAFAADEISYVSEHGGTSMAPTLPGCRAHIAVTSRFSLLLLLLSVFTTTQLPLFAQTFHVLHAFTSGEDGGVPTAGVTLDAAGNIYGTASTNAIQNGGAAYQLKHAGNGWILNPLHNFVAAQGDGVTPIGGLAFAPGGALVGTTYYGGTGGCYAGCGTVFVIRAPQNPCRTGTCAWNERIIHSFTNFDDGSEPYDERLVFDTAGNMYGTTCASALGAGAVFSMTPSGSDTMIHKFTGPDGECPTSGVIFDQAGDLFGTAPQGGANGQGVLYELTPSGSGWNFVILHSFTPSEGAAYSGLVADAAGNFYGMTIDGEVYELTKTNGAWNFSVITTLPGGQGGFGAMAVDAAGNLYGAQYLGGQYNQGAVFKLTPVTAAGVIPTCSTSPTSAASCPRDG